MINEKQINRIVNALFNTEPDALRAVLAVIPDGQQMLHIHVWNELMDCIRFCENLLDESDLELFDSYRTIYEMLKEYDDRGEPSRIVFLFD